VSLVGFAVAGGRSQRMGRDKALLPWGDTDLLGHALARLRSVTDDTRILVGAEPRHTERGFPVEVDAAPDLGPLAGLLAALESAPKGALLLGVDLPLIPSTLLAHLATLCHEGDADAIVPVSRRGPEPLCAAYGPRCLEPVRQHVANRDLKMTSFWPDLRVREIGPDELAAFGDPDELFLNVNTPDDYERALAVAER
jgi:molybdopterin-guanine dinucleotide biosynthesis protein A